MKEYTVKVYEDGSRCWLLRGLIHREDGPAIEYADGTKRWLLRGLLHREDGPAIEWAGGDKSWYLDGEQVTEQEHKRRTNKVRNTASLEQALLDAWDAGFQHAHLSISCATVTPAWEARKEYLEKAIGRVMKSLEKGEKNGQA